MDASPSNPIWSAGLAGWGSLPIATCSLLLLLWQSHFLIVAASFATRRWLLAGSSPAVEHCWPTPWA